MWPMFGGRRQEQFDWHNYVRTTVKLKREHRRRRLQAAQQAALEGVKEAGRGGAASASRGLEALGRVAARSLQAAAEYGRELFYRGLALLGRRAANAGARASAGLRRL